MVNSLANKTKVSTKAPSEESLLTPRFYTTDFEEMRKLLFSEDKVIGVDEHVGTVYADVILGVLSGKPPVF